MECYLATNLHIVARDTENRPFFPTLLFLFFFFLSFIFYGLIDTVIATEVEKVPKRAAVNRSSSCAPLPPLSLKFPPVIERVRLTRAKSCWNYNDYALLSDSDANARNVNDLNIWVTGVVASRWRSRVTPRGNGLSLEELTRSFRGENNSRGCCGAPVFPRARREERIFDTVESIEGIVA